MVLCIFDNGDQNLPIYFASIQGGELPLDSEGEGFSEIRNNVSFNDLASLDTTKNGEDSQQHMINCGDTRVVLRESGQLDITMSKDAKTVCSIQVNNDGNVIIRAASDVQVNSPSIKIESDDFQLNTTTFSVTAKSEASIKAPQTMLVGDSSLLASSPAVDIDATRGMCAIRGAVHSPLFVY